MLFYTMLMPSYVILSYAMLFNAMLCFTMICYAILSYAILSFAMLYLCYATLLFYAILSYSTMLCYAILSNAMLFYALLSNAMLYCPMLLCYSMPHYPMLCSAIDGPVDYTALPESLRYIQRTQGALRWIEPSSRDNACTKSSANRTFWKSLRYHMPPAPQARPPHSSETKDMVVGYRKSSPNPVLMSIKHDIELVASDKLLLITTVIDDKLSFETNADSSTEASLNQL